MKVLSMALRKLCVLSFSRSLVCAVIIRDHGSHETDILLETQAHDSSSPKIRLLEASTDVYQSNSGCSCTKDAYNYILKVQENALSRVPLDFVGLLDANKQSIWSTNDKYNPMQEFKTMINSIQEVVDCAKDTLKKIQCGSCDVYEASSRSAIDQQGYSHSFATIYPGISHFECCCDAALIRDVTAKNIQKIPELLLLNPGAYAFTQVAIHSITNVVRRTIEDVRRPYLLPTIFINEFHYDNTGTDTGEFVEIAGTAGFDLNGYSLVLYNGFNGETYSETYMLSGSLSDQSDGFGFFVVNLPEDGLQNGSPDGFALVGPSDDVVQFLSYEGSFTATNGPANGMTSNDIGFFESSSTPVGSSLQLMGTGDQYEDFYWFLPGKDTKGNANNCQSFYRIFPFAAGKEPQVDVTVFINEFHYDNTGQDAGEFVEIAGTAGSDLYCYSLWLYNGANGKSYDAFVLSGTLSDQLGGFGFFVVDLPENGLQNGSPDGFALVDSSGDVIQFLSYEGSFTAVDGPANGMTSADVVVREVSSTPEGESLQLQGMGNTYGDFTWMGPSSNTKGDANTNQIFTG